VEYEIGDVIRRMDHIKQALVLGAKMFNRMVHPKQPFNGATRIPATVSNDVTGEYDARHNRL
jgi:hypothetical protein